MIQGYYYKHVNGELIYKNSPDAIVDIRDGDLCVAAWPFDPGDRVTAWNVLIEAMALGVSPARIHEMAVKWQCTDADAVNYAERIGVRLGVDGDKKMTTRKDFVNIQESPCGFGETYLEAMASLCKQLGYTGGKMWNHTFESLLK